MMHRTGVDSAARVDRIIARATALLDEQSPLPAQRHLRRLLKLDLQPEKRFAAEVLLARSLDKAGSVAEALSYLGSIESTMLTGDQHSRLDVERAYCLARMSRLREAIPLAVSVLRSSARLSELSADASLVLGIGLYRTGHYKWAQAAYQRAASFYRLADSPVKLAHALMDLGLVAKNRGRLVEALTYLDEASGWLGHRVGQTRLALHMNRGICLLQLGRLESARTCFMEAQGIASATDDAFLSVGIDNNLGHVYKLLGNLEMAGEYYRSALERADASGSVRRQCLALEYLGELFLEQGRAKESLDYLNRAHSLAKRTARHGDLMGEILRRRGEAFAALGDLESARTDLEQAIKLCHSRGERRERVLAERSLALTSPGGDQDLATSIEAVLGALEELHDQFEYARTVALVVTADRLSPTAHPWLAEAAITASHYFNSIGSKYWQAKIPPTLAHKRDLRVEASIQMPRSALYMESRSLAFGDALESIRIAARSDRPALILGETGTGKEIVARLVHGASRRSERRLIAINCAALPKDLIESELFGHVRGAFTGAHRDKPGLFEEADGATVLLDEIAELSTAAQVKLLRFLDEGDFKRVGETRQRRADVHVLAATNRPLRDLVKSGEFRADLLYRLSVFEIMIPPLRERREDIVRFAQTFIAQENNSSRLELSSQLQEWMLVYEWPGNIRELRNVCEYIAARAWGRELAEPSDLPPYLRTNAVPFGGRDASSAFERERLAFEKMQIARALTQSKGNVSGAALLLGMGRNAVARKMHDHGLTRKSFRT